MLLEANGQKILVDVGLGTLHRLLTLGVTQCDIDVICCTHLHPDHVCELAPFLFACNYAERRREKDLTILGGRGFRTFFEALTDVFQGWLRPENFRLSVREAGDVPFQSGEVTIRTGTVRHTRESVAFRFSHGERDLVFSGDTGYCPEIVAFSRAADLLVLECSLPGPAETATHLNPTLAGRIATESGCRRLLLTHFYPACDRHDPAAECGRVYAGELSLARDLMVVEV